MTEISIIKLPTNNYILYANMIDSHNTKGCIYILNTIYSLNTNHKGIHKILNIKVYSCLFLVVFLHIFIYYLYTNTVVITITK